MSLTITAQEKSFSAQVSSDSILVGNYIEVTFTLLNIKGNFVAPDFEGMKIVGGPNHSSSMSSINGDVRQQVSYSYYVEPLEVGDYFIEPAFINESDTDWETQAIKVSVHPNPDGIIERPGMSQNFQFEFGDLFDKDDFFNFGDRSDKKKEATKLKAKRRKI